MRHLLQCELHSYTHTGLQNTHTHPSTSGGRDRQVTRWVHNPITQVVQHGADVPCHSHGCEPALHAQVPIQPPHTTGTGSAEPLSTDATARWRSWWAPSAAAAATAAGRQTTPRPPCSTARRPALGRPCRFAARVRGRQVEHCRNTTTNTTVTRAQTHTPGVMGSEVTFGKRTRLITKNTYNILHKL